MTSQKLPNSGYLVIGMQGGRGPANVPEEMRGALNPVWRETYTHAITLGTAINATTDPKIILSSAADWLNSNIELIWRE